MWNHTGSWFAKTTRGLFAWGFNPKGRLGVGPTEDSQRPHDTRVDTPRRVVLDEEVLEISMFHENVTFIRTANLTGWLGRGDNTCFQMDIPDSWAPVYRPTPIPGSREVTRVMTSFNSTFAWTPTGLLSCGRPAHRQTGVDSRDDDITTLTPVDLPDVKGRVDRVVSNHASSFFLAGRRCFVCGYCSYGVLGNHKKWNFPDPPPEELPFPVDDVITCNATVFRTGAGLKVCGSNLFSLFTDEDGVDNPKVSLTLPRGRPRVTRVAIVDRSMFIRRRDGTWFGRGRKVKGVFRPPSIRKLLCWEVGADTSRG